MQSSSHVGLRQGHTWTRTLVGVGWRGGAGAGIPPAEGAEGDPPPQHDVVVDVDDVDDDVVPAVGQHTNPALNPADIPLPASPLGGDEV
ncbi:hypothetical protein IAT38_003563 [Cryptococcus sp. DSM 104549]